MLDLTSEAWGFFHGEYELLTTDWSVAVEARCSFLGESDDDDGPGVRQPSQNGGVKLHFVYSLRFQEFDDFFRVPTMASC
ncbi:hypothetical protein V6N13_090060 [Hibiscus sabdariffa]|uniref:Uncharacterized protein n=1 Tax=Hibiscus sabdariffa TaxID=183260 RepID=A0ABR2QHX7_9ROSI